MPVSYAKASKSKYRVTLDLEVQEDFNPHNIDWQKVLDVQGNERISSYCVSSIQLHVLYK